MRPVGSVFLLTAAPDVAQQCNPSMAVSAIIVARKVGWLVCVRGLLFLFSFCPFVLQLEVPLLLSIPDTITYGINSGHDFAVTTINNGNHSNVIRFTLAKDLKLYLDIQVGHLTILRWPALRAANILA